MQLTSIVTLAGLAAAVPSPAAPVTVPTPPRGDPTRNVTILHPDQVHQNILKGIHPDHVVSSKNLYNYFKDNHGANHTIYVHDTRRFVNLASVKPRKSNKRETAPDGKCFDHPSHWAEQVQHFWDSWHPAGRCLKNELNSQPSTLSLAWSFTKSISENAGVDWDVIKDVLSLSSEISVTKTWSYSGTIACGVPAKSIGQIWIQNLLVWGWMWSEGCATCGNKSGCGGDWGYNPRADGGAEAPVTSNKKDVGTQNDRGAQYGCSSRKDHTDSGPWV